MIDTLWNRHKFLPGDFWYPAAIMGLYGVVNATCGVLDIGVYPGITWKNWTTLVAVVLCLTMFLICSQIVRIFKNWYMKNMIKKFFRKKKGASNTQTVSLRMERETNSYSTSDMDVDVDMPDDNEAGLVVEPEQGIADIKM